MTQNDTEAGSSAARPALAAAGIVVVCLAAVFAGSALVPGRLVHDPIETNDVTFVGSVIEQWAARVREGVAPLWFGEDSCGTPMAAAWMYGMLYPGLALFLVLPFGMAWAWTAILHIAFGAAGMASFLRHRGASAAAAVSGAVLFGVSEFLVGRTSCGHLNVLLPLCFAPWVLRYADGCVRGERRAVPLLGLALGFGLLSGHVQMWCYLAPLALAVALRETWSSPDRRGALLRLTAGAAIGAGIASPQILLTLAFLREAQTVVPDLEVIRAVSVPPATLATKFVHGWTPWIDFESLRNSAVGQDLEIGQRYDFRHEFRGIAGLGAFAAAAWGVVRGAQRRWFWVGVAVLGIVACFGERVGISSALNHVPPLSLTRAPGRALILVVIAVSVLAAHGIDALSARVAECWRALIPVAAAAHALVLGIAWPIDVPDAMHRMDWASQLPPEVRAHRIHAPDLYQISHFEAGGLRSLRPSVYIMHAGYEALTYEKSAAVAWWVDVGAQVSPQWKRKPTSAEPVPQPDWISGVAIDRLGGMGPARLFGTAQYGVSDAEILRRLRAGERTLFLAGGPVPGDAAARPLDGLQGAVLQRPAPSDELHFAVDTPRDAWLFISIRDDSGWRATVDGAETEIRRGNLAFPVVRVPAGKHDVRLVYRPTAWRVGAVLAAVSLLGAAVLLVATRRPR